MSSFTKPVKGDYAEYFEGYLEHLAADGRDVMTILNTQADGVVSGLKNITEEQANHCYAPGKWSVKELVGHVIDMERLFAFRALWIARMAEKEQPGVDENLWAANSNAGSRSVVDLVEEYQGMRMSHLQLFSGLEGIDLSRRGMVGGFATTINSMPWLVAAHEVHHLGVLRDRYGVDFSKRIERPEFPPGGTPTR